MVIQATRKRSAFTLLEAVIGMTIFTIGSMAILGLAMHLRRSAENAIHSATAMNTAQTVIEQLRALPVRQLGSDPNFLDTPANSVTLVIVPPGGGLQQVTIPINRPPLGNNPATWSWVTVTVPAIASAPAVGTSAPPPPKNINVRLSVCVSEAPANSLSNAREIHVYFTHDRPTPVRAIGTVRSLRTITS